VGQCRAEVAMPSRNLSVQRCRKFLSPQLTLSAGTITVWSAEKTYDGKQTKKEVRTAPRRPSWAHVNPHANPSHERMSMSACYTNPAGQTKVLRFL